MVHKAKVEPLIQPRPITIGIDATNIRGGGGVTHLVELLRAARPLDLGIERVVLWGGDHLLQCIEDRPWLIKLTNPILNRDFVRRAYWQRFYLSTAVRDAGCDVLFVPGGSYAGDFHPVVTMSQNLLPFELPELRRYGLSLFALKLILIRLTQTRAFRNSEAVQFLTNYSQSVVLSVTGKIRGIKKVIPHGLNPCFLMKPREQYPISDYTINNPFRILYVSSVDLYKHQWNVVEAISDLRKLGYHISLDLIGPSFPVALRKLGNSIKKHDPSGNWINYHGIVAYNELVNYYRSSDLGLFASSCENMPNILLESMGAGLPIASSNRGPMPEVLGDCGVYFDPENPSDIFRSVRGLIETCELRKQLSLGSYDRATKFSWEQCSLETFTMLVDVV